MSLPDALLIRNVRPLGAAPVDLLVRDGRIAAIGTALAAPPASTVEDGGGALLLPGLVEGHTHLDKTLWGMAWYRNEVGTRLIDKIDNERACRARQRPRRRRASRWRWHGPSSPAAPRACARHVDIDTEVGLRISKA